MPPIAATLESPARPQTALIDAVAAEARRGLTSTPKSLAPWLFYDEAGSRLFEQITTLPEYYLTRTERDLFTAHADEIFQTLGPNLTIAELGAGTAAKTGILLRALTRQQPHVLYQPIDISPTALDEARKTIQTTIPNVTVRPQTANYVTDTVRIERPSQSLGFPASFHPGEQVHRGGSSLAGVSDTRIRTRVLALYIGSSIGNFSPTEARAILTRLRSELAPGDALLLGADLAPCLAELTPSKSIATLLAAYNDQAGVTAAFNRNILTRLNRDLGANFRPELFAHRALWNHTHSRIEMHLQPLAPHTVHIPAASGAAEVNRSAAANAAPAVNGAGGANGASGGALTLHFTPGETIHTENSYKFTPAAISTLLTAARFTPTRTFTDPANLFAVTLATAI